MISYSSHSTLNISIILPLITRQSGTRMYGEKTAGSNVRLARRTLSIRNFSIPLRPVTFTSQIRLPRSSQQSFTSCTEENSGGNMPQTTVSIHNLSVPLQSVMFTSPEMGLHDAADQQSNWYSILHAKCYIRITLAPRFLLVHSNNDRIIHAYLCI